MEAVPRYLDTQVLRSWTGINVPMTGNTSLHLSHGLRYLFFKFLFVSVGLCIPSISPADLVRLSHYPAALHAFSGITDEADRRPWIKYSNWKITGAAQNLSPYANGVVIAVKEGIVSHGQEENDYLSWLYAPGTKKFKAVYILTNHHVWTNDRSKLQSMSEDLNPNSRLYMMMIATPLFIFNKSRQDVFGNTYFLLKYPINQWNGTSYEFSPENMGLKELVNCYEPEKNVNEIGRLNFWWGCDFTLVRIIVPYYDNVQPEVLSPDRPSRGMELDVWYSAEGHGNFRVEKLFGPNGEAIVADISVRSAMASFGWSGSPVLNKADGKLVGLLFSNWPRGTTKIGFYDIQYIMKNLNVNARIEEDFKRIEVWNYSTGPLKSNSFYGKFTPSFP